VNYPPRLFIFIVLSLFVIIVLFPIFYMFFSSFWSDGLTISHYSCFLNPHYLKIALNSLIIAFGTTFFSLLIGTPQAFLLQRTKVSWRNFFKVAYFIPSFFISCFIEKKFIKCFRICFSYPFCHTSYCIRYWFNKGVES